jgi:hypothetical protein
MVRLKILAVAGLCGTCAMASAFETSIAEPRFTVSVPALPVVQLAEQSASSAPASRHFAGDDGTYSVSLDVARAERSITTRECAGSRLRSLIARPGMPARDSVYRVPLNEQTFLVIYVLDSQAGPVLHAHLLASVASTHCIEAHFSRAKRTGEDEDDWRRSFQGASVVERAR